MAIGNFLNLYAKTYMILSGIYPKICPQEMGIISEMEAFRNQGKVEILINFNQSDWQRYQTCFKKSGLCFQRDFCGDLNYVNLLLSLKNNDF